MREARFEHNDFSLFSSRTVNLMSAGDRQKKLYVWEDNAATHARTNGGFVLQVCLTLRPGRDAPAHAHTNAHAHAHTAQLLVSAMRVQCK